MSVITKSVEVDVPIRAAYDQWTQFEDFPRFMEGVERVDQLDDVRLHWHVNIGGVDREFEARIEEQDPDRRVAWRATEGEDQAGTVTFEPLGADRTRVELELQYESERWTDKVADFFNVVDKRAEGDLQRFKEFIEEKGGRPTGAWRGEVDQGEPKPPAGGGTGIATEPGGGATTEPGISSPASGGTVGEPPERT